jgi:hypothetical protein
MDDGTDGWKGYYYVGDIVLLAYGKPCDQYSSITVVCLDSFDTNYNNICRNLEKISKF